MGKKILNSLTKKDGNKLGKRKREKEWLKIEFKSRMNPIDIKSLAEDILERIDEKRETSVLPNITGVISEILSMDKGMSSGDFMACCTVGVGGEQDLWRSNISHMTMMQAMESSRIPKVIIGMETNKDEIINRMKAYIKVNVPSDVVDEIYKRDDSITDRKPEWLNPRMMDYIGQIGCSKDAKIYEACDHIFLRARTIPRPDIVCAVKIKN